MNNHATVQSSAPVSAAPLLQVSGALIAIIALILDVEDARLVLGVTAGQINLLHKLPPSAPTEEIPQPDFQSVMKNLLKRGGRS